MPRRRHRPRQPWRSLELSPKERADQVRLEPVRRLASVLVGDGAARQAVADLRSGLVTEEELACQYVWRAGYTRDVAAAIFREAARSPSPDPRRAILSLADGCVFVDAPLDEGDPRQWPHTDPSRRVEAAAMLAAMGADRCMKLCPGKAGMKICRAIVARDGQRRRYCSMHEPRTDLARKVDRADRDAITELLRAVGDALEIPERSGTPPSS